MDVPVGLQLYSVRRSLKQDPWGTLEALAELGVRRIEAANHDAGVDDGVGFGVDTRSFRRSTVRRSTS